MEKIAGQIQIFDLAPRSIVCATACELSIEHAHATRALFFFCRRANSACTTLRSQYEAVLRGAWALHVATDHQVKKHGQPLDADLRGSIVKADDRRCPQQRGVNESSCDRGRRSMTPVVMAAGPVPYASSTARPTTAPPARPPVSALRLHRGRARPPFAARLPSRSA